MQAFTPFEKIRKVDVKNLEVITEEFGEERCVVTEKIMGCNFSVSTNGTGVRFARRNAYLEDDESFYGYQYVAEPLKERILEMHHDIKEMVMEMHKAADLLEAKGEPCQRPDIPRDFQELKLIGEFCGGKYPHDDLPQLKNGHGHVGKGKIWYGQDKTFLAFELQIDGVVQDFYQMGSLCSSFGIPMAPALFFGSFEECMEFSREHITDQTIVPLKQPQLDENNKPLLNPEGNYISLPELKGNEIEGHVISTVYPKWNPVGERLMVKHKNPKYLKDTKVRRQRKVPIMSEEILVIYDEVSPLITLDRMESTMSKCSYGKLAFMDMCDALARDAVDEWFTASMSTKSSDYLMLSDVQHKELMKHLTHLATDMCREEFFLTFK